jgi:hypothetical protein
LEYWKTGRLEGKLNPLSKGRTSENAPTGCIATVQNLFCPVQKTLSIEKRRSHGIMGFAEEITVNYSEKAAVLS